MKKVWIVGFGGEVRCIDQASLQPAARIKPAAAVSSKNATKKVATQTTAPIFRSYDSGTMSSSSVHRFGIRLR